MSQTLRPQDIVSRELGMPADAVSARVTTSKPEWYRAIAKYGRSNPRKALWQIFNTFVPYFAVWALMVHTVQQGYSYWITLMISVLAAGLLVRIFILFHDCCHGSFLPSRRTNTILGYVSGVIAFTSFHDWRYSHNLHHASAGDLDRRGAGAVRTMTKEEYLAASTAKRLAYRIYRNPFVFLGPGAALLFLVFQRLSTRGAGKRERDGVIFTNFGLMVIAAIASFFIGFKTYVLVQLPIILIGGTFGLWLFYVQHQFENVYWARHEVWDPLRVALEGSSYFKLPKVLQWFSANIGLHHIHHVRPAIPNYELQRCYNDIPALRAIEPMTIAKSFSTLKLSLFDEEENKMIGFGSLNTPAAG
ncbi:MAG TPA: fatty acid desaturase [Candidatus Binatia bacterium]